MPTQEARYKMRVPAEGHLFEGYALRVAASIRATDKHATVPTSV